MSSDYEQEFKIFSSNVNQAARSLYYHIEINKQIYDNGQKQENGYFQYSKLYQAVNANAQFWNDYKYSSIHYTVIILGRIFDRNKKSHGIRRLVKTAKNSGSFTIEKLRERKIASSDNSDEWIDEYMADKRDINSSEYLQLLRYIFGTIELWNKIKPVRNKRYAHQDVMTDFKKQKILQDAEYSVIEDIIKRLLTIEYVYQEAYANGRLPDLEYNNIGVRNRVREDTRTLLERLVNSAE